MCINSFFTNHIDTSEGIFLTISVPLPDEEKKMKIKYFHTSLWCFERFDKGPVEGEMLQY